MGGSGVWIVTIVRTDQELDAQVLEMLRTYGHERFSVLAREVGAESGDVARSLSRLELNNLAVRRGSWWSLNGQDPAPFQQSPGVQVAPRRRRTRAEPTPVPSGDAPGPLTKADLLFALAEAEREAHRLAEEIHRHRTIAELLGRLIELMWPEQPRV